jgi:hypothetical protein
MRYGALIFVPLFRPSVGLQTTSTHPITILLFLNQCFGPKMPTTWTPENDRKFFLLILKSSDVKVSLPGTLIIPSTTFLNPSPDSLFFSYNMT